MGTHSNSVSEMEERGKDGNGTPNDKNGTPTTGIVDGAINFVRAVTHTNRKKTNEYLKMDVRKDSIDTNTIDPFNDIDIDVDLNRFLPLIQRVLEQCHLLLMDSYSRFKNERDRKVEYDMEDEQIRQQH